MLAPAVAFVDLETTGTVAVEDGITEIAILRVENGALAEEWSTLVDPGQPIPSEVQRLTGITNAMVRGAPAFADVAVEVRERLEGRLFVAHNARFDYGFLKNAFARAGMPFSARTLCTARLSRRLFPGERRHNLDSVIARHGLVAECRHRALADARVLWRFVQALYATMPAQHIEDAVRALLRTPSLPPQLPPEALASIPESPGVYLFYGLNPLPLYIGKSVNLRERVRSHFSADHRSATDARLSAEIARVEHHETAGELGAMLLEARLVKALLPAHNQRLRRLGELAAIRLAERDERPRILRAPEIAPGDVPDLHGVFASRRGARECLRELLARHRLCAKAIGLEHGPGPCFAYQLRRCAGACVGDERPEAHRLRLAAALSPLRVPRWAWRGPIGVRERSPEGGRAEVHVFEHWCHLGSARGEDELDELLGRARPRFDLDTYRMLAQMLRRRSRPPEVVDLSARAAHLRRAGAGGGSSADEGPA